MVKIFKLDINIDKLTPTVSSIEGGLIIKITGTGLFDSMFKKAHIISSLGSRFTDLNWERNEKSLILVSNPLFWITDDDEIIKKMSPIELYEGYRFDVNITMNGVDWISAGSYRYCDPKLLRISWANFPPHSSLENRLIILGTEEALTNEEKIILEMAPKPEDKKKLDEITKKFKEEDFLIENQARRPYSGLYLYGSYFPKTDVFKYSPRQLKFVSKPEQLNMK